MSAMQLFELFRCQVGKDTFVHVMATSQMTSHRWDRLANLLHQQARILKDVEAPRATPYEPPAEAVDEVAVRSIELARLQVERDKLLNENAALDSANDRLHKALDRLRGEHAALSARAESAEARIDTLLGELAEAIATGERGATALTVLGEVTTALAEVSTISVAPLPAQDNVPDQPIPASDETDAADPFTDPASDQKAEELAASRIPEAPPAKPAREILTFKAGTGTFVLDGVFHHFTHETVWLLDKLREPKTVHELLDLGFGDGVAHVKRLMQAARGEVVRATGYNWSIVQIAGAKVGAAPRKPSTYVLKRIVGLEAQPAAPVQETPAPVLHAAAQDEGAAGATPGQEDAAIGEGDLASTAPPEASAFVAPPVEGEGVVAPADPSPAADEAEPAAVPTPASPLIAPGHVIAVDLKRYTVMAPKGLYDLEGRAKMARTLNVLKTGEMFGLTYLAKVGQWNSPEVARNALAMESAKLKRHGVELYLDRVNARLRVVGGSA